MTLFFISSDPTDNNSALFQVMAWHKKYSKPLHKQMMTDTTKATFTYARSSCGAEAGGFWHSRSATTSMSTHTRSGCGWICHFLKTNMVWSVRFQSGSGKLGRKYKGYVYGVGSICCGADFAPGPLLLHNHVCVNACNDLCWSQFSTRLHPRPLKACVNVPLSLYANMLCHVLQCQHKLVTYMILSFTSINSVSPTRATHLKCTVMNE